MICGIIDVQCDIRPQSTLSNLLQFCHYFLINLENLNRPRQGGFVTHAYSWDSCVICTTYFELNTDNRRWCLEAGDDAEQQLKSNLVPRANLGIIMVHLFYLSTVSSSQKCQTIVCYWRIAVRHRKAAIFCSICEKCFPGSKAAMFSSLRVV